MCKIRCFGGNFLNCFVFVKNLGAQSHNAISDRFMVFLSLMSAMRSLGSIYCQVTNSFMPDFFCPFACIIHVELILSCFYLSA
jgi:hypothetical protein